MAQSNSFNEIVSTVRSVFDPKNDSRIISILNDYYQSVEAYDKSPKISLLTKRRQAFAKVQQLRDEVRSRIEVEIIKYANSSMSGDKHLDKTKIYWAVMQGQREFDPENISGNMQANSIDPRKTQDTLPRPKVGSQRSQHQGIIKDDYRSCNFPGCTWKVELHRGSTTTLRTHLEAEHNTTIYTCRAGCNRTFITTGGRRMHEHSKHPNSSVLRRLKRTSLGGEDMWFDHRRPNGDLDSGNLLTENDGQILTEVDIRVPVEEHNTLDMKELREKHFGPETNEQGNLDLESPLTENDERNPAEADIEDIPEGMPVILDPPPENAGQSPTEIDMKDISEAMPENAVEAMHGSGTSDHAFNYCPYPNCPWKSKNAKSFRASLRAHIRSKHENKRYPCSVSDCHRTFITDQHRKIHETNIHLMSPAKHRVTRIRQAKPIHKYFCGAAGCPYRFASEDIRRRHRAVAHGLVEQQT